MEFTTSLCHCQENPLLAFSALLLLEKLISKHQYFNNQTSESGTDR